MSSNSWVRQVHRWLSLIFTLAVIANLIAMFTRQQAVWVGLLALFPLIPLMITGLWMFFRPYLARHAEGPTVEA